MTGLRFVAWLRHWAFNLMKGFGESLGEPYATMHAGTLVREFIARPGVLQLKGDKLWVRLAPFTDSEALAGWIQRINQQRIAIPWLGHLVLQMEVASLRVRQGDRYVPDDLLDEQSLFLQGGELLIVVLGCAHPGMINTIEHARRVTGIER